MIAADLWRAKLAFDETADSVCLYWSAAITEDNGATGGAGVVAVSVSCEVGRCMEACMTGTL